MEDSCTDCGEARDTNRYGICDPCATARLERVRDEIREANAEAGGGSTQATFEEFAVDD